MAILFPAEFEHPPDFAPPDAGSQVDLNVRIVTVLYGGGVEPGKVDTLTPFRAPSVRGHLRYWWRATRGARFTHWRDLHEEETKIWGATDQKSPVTVRVLDANPGHPIDPGEPQYALFPAHQASDKPKLYRNGSFRLLVFTARETVQEVSTALWAWFTFGGIGARTRRGAGALYCDKYGYSWDANNILGDGRPREWPTLKGGRAVIGSQRRPWDQCWKEVVKLLQEFRQDRVGPCGRSKWPEADEIRSIRGRWEPRHAPRLQGGGFPRARLGLPIIFHFKDRGDPRDNTLSLKPLGGEGDPKDARMASPVIVKPWAVSDREAVPLLVVLNTHEPSNLVLIEGHDETPVTLGARDAIDELVRRAEARWRVRAKAI
jgi:CRISPR-associated protein Cmr1